tara:strand:+ start:305 stop:436 length:132 start_codon:yes stop_codon:yes gene_type:complete
MLLLEDEMGYMVNKFHQDLFLKTKIKKMYVREGVFLVLMFDFL